MPHTPTPPRYDVIAIGNAIVDVLAPCEEARIEELQLVKGAMTLIDADGARALYSALGPAQEISGGSAANTLVGLAHLGVECAFIGQVADDPLGDAFRRDIRAAGIAFDTPARTGAPPTGRCLIFVTPDGERTMNTFLGASQCLPPAAIRDDTIADAAVLYLEGYLWDPEGPRSAMRRAIDSARAAGRTVALTASERFVIDHHGDDFRALIAAGMIDILFLNEGELASLTGETDFDAGLATLAPDVPILVATRGAGGAVAMADGRRSAVAAEAVAQVVDTTGAGDQFAAGFLSGHVRGDSVEHCLIRGAVCAAEVIAHYGARPQADVHRLVADRLGERRG